MTEGLRAFFISAQYYWQKQKKRSQMNLTQLCAPQFTLLAAGCATAGTLLSIAALAV